MRRTHRAGIEVPGTPWSLQEAREATTAPAGASLMTDERYQQLLAARIRQELEAVVPAEYHVEIAFTPGQWSYLVEVLYYEERSVPLRFAATCRLFAEDWSAERLELTLHKSARKVMRALEDLCP